MVVSFFWLWHVLFKTTSKKYFFKHFLVIVNKYIVTCDWFTFTNGVLIVKLDFCAVAEFLAPGTKRITQWSEENIRDFPYGKTFKIFVVFT